MAATLDHDVADLKRQLDEARAERDEAEARQAAMAEILEIINSSPGDLAPVFDAMLEKATRLCDAEFGTLWTYGGKRLHPAGLYRVPAGFAEFLREPISADESGVYAAIVGGQGFVHVPDLADSDAYREGQPLRRATVDLGGARTGLAVAIRKDKTLLGIFAVYRQEVRPFSHKQIALLQNFATQAVVAMGNARLLTETREALEQQTAAAEVLQVINSSPGDLKPIFEAMVHKAIRLCDAASGTLWTYDGQRFAPAALSGASRLAELFEQHDPSRASPGTPGGQLLAGERVVHILDVKEDPIYRAHPRFREMADIENCRTFVAVGLRKENVLLGMITVYREEVRPFSVKQIGLLQNFAEQAVIAIENARLINETREALEQQTATAEVLGVINSSPGDLAPVFDALLEKAMRLCEAEFGLLRTFDGEAFHAAASRGVPTVLAEFWRVPRRPSPGLPLYRLMCGENLVHIPDVTADDIYRSGDPIRRAFADEGGARTGVWVALRKEASLLGAIVIYRKEVRSFSDKQIALLQNFAEQAVIAMENARLITETREALEQQTATAEVLQVINSSPGDLDPVFDAMLEKAIRLCNAASGHFRTYNGESFPLASVRGDPQHVEQMRQRGPIVPGPHNPVARLLEGEDVTHFPDAAQTHAYRNDARFRELVDRGVRSLLAVPLRKGDVLLGYINVYRHVTGPFTARQIALLQNFAAQAVIAMENARLVAETHEALEQQTATAEVLRVINSSPGDLAPVFDAMLEKATRLCDGTQGVLWTVENSNVRCAAMFGVSAEYAAFLRRGVTPGPTTPMGRILGGERIVEVVDLMADEGYRAGDLVPRAAVEVGGFRSMVFVALIREEKLLGAFAIGRSEVRAFTDKQIALLQNFAAQAVIAMENARLITETREALEQQTATAEVLGVINSSPGDLGPVFGAILEKAHSLCGVSRGVLASYDGKHARAVATQGLDEPLANLLRRPFRPLPNSPYARLIRDQRTIHIADITVEGLWDREDPNLIATVKQGVRTMLFVPLQKEDILLGWITANRSEVRPFSDKEIALLESFATQAVIAMENARLLDEIRQRQAELRVTFDNMADGVAMFDEHLRLAAWNRNFQQIADLPEALLGGRPSYADYLRILTARGELDTLSIDAELSRRLEHTDQELRLERTRPNGQVIEVRRNAVPDGGFVLIYSDITERKRSEAEIRAARDTAEATLRELRAAQSSLIQAQKMAALGQLTAGIAHEIKNPLNFVNNFAGLSVELLDELKETAAPAIETLDENTRAEIDDAIEMLTGNLEKIAEHGKRADNIVKSMLEHSRGVTSERRKVDLNNLVEEALNLTYHGARAQDQGFNITLEREYDRNIGEIAIIPQEVNRVFINLIGNGFYAASKRQQESGDGSFRPILKVTTRDLGEAVEVSIRDNGVGIPPEIKDKLFQPFFTTKPTGEGTGLGLSISYDIVTQQHGGNIEVESEAGEFTEFRVRIPRSYRATAEAAS